MMVGIDMSRNLFRRLKVVITLVAAYFAIVSKSNIDWNNLTNNVVDSKILWELIYDLSVGVLSAMVLVWFIDEINDKIKEDEARENERRIIERFDRIIQRHFKRYILLYYCVVTPMSERDFNNVRMHEKFMLKDMRELHYMTLLSTESLLVPSVVAFLNVELEIKKEFCAILKEQNFYYYKGFADILEDYIFASLGDDCRNNILSHRKMRNGKEPLINDVWRYLNDSADKDYEEFENGISDKVTIGLPYFQLRMVMQKERNIILRYQEEIKKIRN